jgi:DNA-binding MarR family transcriptional regulator
MSAPEARDRTDDIWLDPHESPGYLVRDANIAVGKALRRRLAEYGMTLGQYYFMRALWIEEGLSQRELSRRVGTTEPTTASVLRLLEKNGLVRRVRNRRDRRTINIFPTQKGRSLKSELLRMAININEIATDGFSAADVEKLKQLMMAMKANLDRDERSSSV